MKVEVRMKTLVLALCLCLLTPFAYAEKPTNYVTVKDVRLLLAFNVERPTTTTEGEMVMYYLPIYIQIVGQAVTSDGGTKGVRQAKELGTPSLTPLTNKQLYQLLPAQLQGLFKDLIQDAINENVTE